MAKNVHVVPRDGGWGVLREGNDRAGSIHRKQETAIAEGRGTAKRDHVELVVHGRDGRIRAKDSLGNDPFPPRDRR